MRSSDPSNRVAVILAYVQLASAFFALVLAFQSDHSTDKDAWTIFYSVLPLIAMLITAPANIISGIHYFIKYRKDALTYKVIVGLGMLSGATVLVLIGG